MIDVLTTIRSHCASLTAEQRVDLLADAADLVASADDLAAVLEALARRGRPVLALIREQRAEIDDATASVPSRARPTLRDEGYSVEVPAETARHWRKQCGGADDLGRVLLDGYITEQPADRPDRVNLLRRSRKIGDVSAVAERRGPRELYVIHVRRRRR